jgi:flagellar biosynthesis regulator FlbT
MGNDELNDIDYVEVFQKTKRFFTSYFKLLLITSVLGVTLSVLNFYVAENYYITEFVVSNGGTNKEIAKTLFIAPDESYYSEDNLDVSEKEIDVILEDIRNTKKVFADTVMQDALRFEIKIYDNGADIKSLRNTIISLLTKNKYLIENNAKRKEDANIQLNQVKEEIQIIDSLQGLMLLNTDAVTINSTDFSKNLVDLKKYQIELEKEISEIGVYKIIRDIYKPETPERKLASSILFGIILGFFLGIVIGIIHQLNKLSKSR